jgi:hypothetical protein
MEMMGMILAIIGLTVFLIYVTALKYVIGSPFVRTRLIMTSFFVFIVVTLTISFWQYALVSLKFTVPTALVGMLVGYVVGVREAERKLMAQGIEHYLEHFAHVHIMDLQKLHWWSLINFYSIMGGLLLINLVGLSTVIFKGRESWAIATCAVGAFLLGSIVPYLVHLWSIKHKQKNKSTTSEI